MQQLLDGERFWKGSVANAVSCPEQTRQCRTLRVERWRSAPRVPTGRPRARGSPEKVWQPDFQVGLLSLTFSSANCPLISTNFRGNSTGCQFLILKP